MKKKYILILFIIFSISKFYSENNLRIGVVSGIKNLSITNTVYPADLKTKNSFLEWNQDIIPIVGLNLAYQYAAFFISSNFIAGIPMTAGSMFDSDWNFSGLKTNYSISQCDTIYDFNTEIELGYSFRPDRFFTISPLLLFEYHYNNFVAHDGHGWYGNYNRAYSKVDYDVAWNDPLARKVKIANIDYYRHFLIFFMGFEFGFYPIKKLTIKSSFNISPIIYAYSFDTHHGGNNLITGLKNPDSHYIDIETGYFSKYKLKFESSYELNSKINLNINISYLFGSEDYGNLYHDYYTDKISKSETQMVSANYKSLITFLGLELKI